LNTEQFEKNEDEEEIYLWYENISILSIFYGFILCIMFYGVVINRDHNEKENTKDLDNSPAFVALQTSISQNKEKEAFLPKQVDNEKTLKLRECLRYIDHTKELECELNAPELKIDYDINKQCHKYIRGKIMNLYSPLMNLSLDFFWYDDKKMVDTDFRSNKFMEYNGVISFVMKIDWQVGDKFTTIKNGKYYESRTQFVDDYGGWPLVECFGQSGIIMDIKESEAIVLYSNSDYTSSQLVNNLRRTYETEEHQCRRLLIVDFHDFLNLPSPNAQYNLTRKPGETIYSIRNKIEKYLTDSYIIKSRIVLYYNDEYLDADEKAKKTLEDYNYIDGFNLTVYKEVESKKVSTKITYENGRTITEVSFTEESTINYLYDQIPEEIKSQYPNFALKFSGFLLEKSRTVKSYGMSHRSASVQVIKNVSKKEIIFRKSNNIKGLHIQDDKKLLLEGENIEFSIKNLKQKAGLGKYSVLVYNRKVLKDDSKSLRYYKYTPNAIIYYKDIS
jgi:hypothetical protein